MDFALTVTLDPPTARLAASGELDIFSACEVADRLHAAAGLGCSRVLLDVSGVTFVDVSALGVLERASALLGADQRTVGVVDAPVAFRRTCALAGLDATFGLN